VFKNISPAYLCDAVNFLHFNGDKMLNAGNMKVYQFYNKQIKNDWQKCKM
jgi:hypothetical protein